MKKYAICFILISLVVTPIVASASYNAYSIWAQKMNYTIKVDGKVLNDMQVYNIDNSAYVPIRSFCDGFDMKVEWISDSESVNILTDEEPASDLGIEISKDAAAGIADAILCQKYGEDFTKNNSIKTVDESIDEKSYTIHRHKAGIVYKDYNITISKVNGKVLTMSVK